MELSPYFDKVNDELQRQCNLEIWNFTKTFIDILIETCKLYNGKSIFMNPFLIQNVKPVDVDPKLTTKLIPYIYVDNSHKFYNFLINLMIKKGIYWTNRLSLKSQGTFLILYMIQPVCIIAQAVRLDLISIHHIEKDSSGDVKIISPKYYLHSLYRYAEMNILSNEDEIPPNSMWHKAEKSWRKLIKSDAIMHVKTKFKMKKRLDRLLRILDDEKMVLSGTSAAQLLIMRRICDSDWKSIASMTFPLILNVVDFNSLERLFPENHRIFKFQYPGSPLPYKVFQYFDKDKILIMAYNNLKYEKIGYYTISGMDGLKIRIASLLGILRQLMIDAWSFERMSSKMMDKIYSLFIKMREMANEKLIKGFGKMEITGGNFIWFPLSTIKD